MKIGQKYKHVHLLNCTCEILALTNKGAKVLLIEDKRKPKIAFFDSQDFKERPIFIKL